jgi:hypothetical protein
MEFNYDNSAFEKVLDNELEKMNNKKTNLHSLRTQVCFLFVDNF